MRTFLFKINFFTTIDNSDGYVGLGSDFDNSDFDPKQLKDVSDYPNLLFEMLKRGYSEKRIWKVLGENSLRVLQEVEQISESPQLKINKH